MEREKFLDFVYWMSTHDAIRCAVCCDGFDLSPEECLSFIETLEHREYYELIYVLLIKTETNVVIQQALARLVAGTLRRAWAQLEPAQLVQSLKQLLQEEIQRTNPEERA